MALKLYNLPASPPARGVRMTAKALGLTLELQEVDVLKQEQIKPEFLKINPTHTIPVLDDNGFIVWDSHAIVGYLVDKYGKNDSLYPKDVKQRAIVNQILHLDNGKLFPRLGAAIRPVLLTNATSIPDAILNEIKEAYGFLESILEKNKWLAGDSLTIGDISVVSTVTTMNVFLPIDAKAFPKVAQWLKNMESQPFYSENVPGLEIITGFVKSKLK